MAKTRTVTLTDNATGKSFEAPVIEGTHGRPVIDIKGISQELGYFVHDPGYAFTSRCRSAITYIDGEQGVLLYRGYPIEQLAESSSYLEVCYLLLSGELPTPEQWEEIARNQAEQYAFFERVVEARRESPREDLVSALVRARDESDSLARDCWCLRLLVLLTGFLP